MRWNASLDAPLLADNVSRSFSACASVCGRSITARGTSFGRFFFARFQRGPRASTCQRKKTKARQCTALRQTAKSIRVFIVTAARKIRRRAGGAARRGGDAGQTMFSDRARLIDGPTHAPINHLTGRRRWRRRPDGGGGGTVIVTLHSLSRPPACNSVTSPNWFRVQSPSRRFSGKNRGPFSSVFRHTPQRFGTIRTVVQVPVPVCLRCLRHDASGCCVSSAVTTKVSWPKQGLRVQSHLSDQARVATRYRLQRPCNLTRVITSVWIWADNETAIYLQ